MIPFTLTRFPENIKASPQHHISLWGRCSLVYFLQTQATFLWPKSSSIVSSDQRTSFPYAFFPGSSGHTSVWLDGVSSAVLLTLQPHSPFLLRIPVIVSYQTTIPDLAKSYRVSWQLFWGHQTPRWNLCFLPLSGLFCIVWLDDASYSSSWHLG